MGNFSIFLPHKAGNVGGKSGPKNQICIFDFHLAVVHNSHTTI